MSAELGKRVAILGCAGSGKSTLARELAKLLTLPCVHLDAHFWQAGWVEPDKQEWDAKLQELTLQDSWIMDGNYSRGLALRLQRADTVIFLDFKRSLCLRRVFKRRRMYKNEVRPDMAEGCAEKIDWEFLKWIWNYNKRTRPKILQALEGFEREVVVLKCPKQVQKFLQDIK